MKVLLALLCILFNNPQELRPNPSKSLRAGTADESPSRKCSITFVGTVKSIEQLGRKNLRVIPVDLDSRFAITIHIEAVTPAEVPLKPGADHVFAVHSPARLFRAVTEEIIDKKYRFKVDWNVDNNQFSDLTAVLPDKDMEKKLPGEQDRRTSNLL
ncbi:MAG TPA: hypothetical protein VLE19_06990 [Pyrinomonadaceae bacterium]|nr:hypothetical protein [Pyrinomonadaceae bacterium]